MGSPLATPKTRRLFIPAALSRIELLRPFLNPHSSLLHRTARGTAWLFLLRFAEKGMGLIRTLVLARLLAPSEFGLFGIVVIAVNALDLLSVVGMKAAVVQQKNATDDDFDTAWSVLLIQGVFNAIALCVIAGPAAHFFKEPRAVLLIRCFAIAVLFEGFVNIGIVCFDRALQFKQQFKFIFAGAASDLAVALIVAYLTHSVYALLAGAVAGKIVRVAASYAMQRYRPKFRIVCDKFRILFRFGKWMWLSTLLQFVLFQGDNIFVGRVLGATALGLYGIAFTVGNLTRTDISIVLQRALFPSMALLQDDDQASREAYLKISRAVTLLVLPVSCGIALIASTFIQVALGKAWLPAAPVLRILCMAGLFNALLGNAAVMLRAKGFANHASIGEIWYLTTGALLIYPASRIRGLNGVALAVAVASMVGWLWTETRALRILGLHWTDQIRTSYRNVLATLVMMAGVEGTQRAFPTSWNKTMLLMLPIAGVFIYVMSVFALSSFKVEERVVSRSAPL
jgi:lipopolysaccharide exporter